MSTQYNLTIDQYLAKKRRAKYFMRFLALFSAGGTGVLLGVAASIIFPGLGIPFFILIGISTTLLEGRMLWHQTEKSFISLFIRGLFSTIKQNLIVKELTPSLLKFSGNPEPWAQEFEKDYNAILRKMLDGQEGDSNFERAIIAALKKDKHTIAFLKEAKENNGGATVNKKSMQKVMRVVMTIAEKYHYHTEEGMPFKSFIQKVQSVKDQPHIQSSYRKKSAFIVLAILLSILSGVITGMATYTAVSIFLAGLTFIALAPIAIWILAAIIAAAAVITYTFLMLRTLEQAIKHDFFHKLAKSLKKSFSPKDGIPFTELSRKEKFFHILKCSALGFLLGLVSTGLLLLAFATAGSYINQCVAFFLSLSQSLASYVFAISSVAGVFVYLSYIPTWLMFNFQANWALVSHIFVTVETMITERQALLNAIKEKLIDVKQNPRQLIKLPFYLVGYLLVGGAMILHFIGASAFSARGVESENSHLVGIFALVPPVIDKIASWFKTTGENLVALTEIVTETFNHLFFLGGHDHGDNTPAALGEGLYNLSKLTYQGFKKTYHFIKSCFSKLEPEKQELMEEMSNDLSPIPPKRESTNQSTGRPSKTGCGWLSFFPKPKSPSPIYQVVPTVVSEP